jgi:hypothetical protein
MMNLAKYGIIQQGSILGSGIYMTITDYGMSQVWRSINAANSITLTGSSIGSPVGVAMSSDGVYQTVTGYSSGIFRSADYGVSWTQVKSSAYQWQMVAMSSTGQYQLASDSYAGATLWRSIDYGASWSVSGSSKNNGYWYGVAVSDSGQYMFASGQGTSIYYSSNYGASWSISNVTSPYTYNWRYISMNNTGQYGITCDWDYGITYVYKTSNYGVTWSAITGLGSAQWNCSAGGSSYFLVCNTTYCYRSTDNGASWNIISSIGGGLTCSISRSGATQTIIDVSYNIWRSLDYGTNWVNLGRIISSPQNIAISNLVI